MLVVVLLGALVVIGPVPVAGALTTRPAVAPRGTVSRYERTASPRTLYAQGAAAGRTGAQGVVILDFGRPAAVHGVLGTMAFGGRFLPFSSIERGIERYLLGYLRTAPAYTTLDVALGTNDSCGTGQPCGATVCGCRNEPASFTVFGEQLAVDVLALDNWLDALKSLTGFTDVVHVVAADDAEPAFDPGFANTADLLAGYAATVGGSWPPMIDYGSAEPHYWSEAQLFEVAYGFAPDVPMPEIYYAFNAVEWADLLAYAEHRLGRAVRIQGVLTERAHATNRPAAAYQQMLAAASGITGQQAIPWLSQIVR